MYSQIIHLDGADKTGKDTIRRTLTKIVKGNYVIYSRSYMSCIAYSRIYSRNLNERFFIENMKRDFERGDKFFLLEASFDEAEFRFKKHSEKDLELKNYEVHKRAFSDLADELNDKHGVLVSKVDTTNEEETFTSYKINGLIQEQVIKNCANCSLCDTNSRVNRVHLGNKYIVLNLHSYDEYVYDMLCSALFSAGVIQNSLMTYIQKCSSEKFDPNATDKCMFHLRHEIESINPTKVIAVGNYCYEFLMKNRLFPEHKIITIPSPKVSSVDSKAATYIKDVKTKLAKC